MREAAVRASDRIAADILRGCGGGPMPSCTAASGNRPLTGDLGQDMVLGGNVGVASAETVMRSESRSPV